ncbi:MAG: AraC family transcriptional regulator [Acidobacteriota bacterium]|jgi:AraC family transcriptional regulator|nr:AraC family transcriptional regulator [Acidobacteriota bacterium]
MKRIRTQPDRIFLRPQYALHYRRASRATWTSEARADYVVLLQLAGRLACNVGEVSIEIDEHGALLLDPGMAASARTRDAEYLTLSLSPAFMLDCAARTKLIGAGASVSFRTRVVEHDERLARLAHDLATELTQEEAGQEMVIAALIEQLIVHLLRHHSNVRRSEELELSRVGLVDRRIRRAIELMHAHLSRELPLEEIAAAAYLSPFHFARLFKKLTGASPHAYLATLRTAHAQTLLADTDLSISEVSARVGYSSPSHFTKAFRQATGLTPRAFRKAVVSSQWSVVS